MAGAFLVVTILDLTHLLSYPGMVDFITGNTPHKALEFGALRRCASALARLLFVLLPSIPVHPVTPRAGWMRAAVVYLASRCRSASDCRTGCWRHPWSRRDNPARFGQPKGGQRPLGHQHGDPLLILVARRIEAAIPAGAALARMGGDEFAILQSQVADAE